MSTPISPEDKFPQIPTFSEELWDRCRKEEDFRPILFEWYKYVGLLCNTLASISLDSPAIREIPALNYAILTGLLNRCSRLMAANIRLAVTKKYGETIMLLDRSIYESVVIVRWLCYKDSEESFQRFLADGTKSDLKLKEHIQQSITDHGGKVLVIENSMLSSIQECIESTGLSEEQILITNGLPDLFSMCRDVGLSERYYIGTQRMGSHAIHGSWTSLRSHYLRQDVDGKYHLRDHDVPPHENQLMVIPIMLLGTLKNFIEYVVPVKSHREPIDLVLDKATSEMEKLTQEIVNSDLKFDF